jgi:endogenous inhibitor of DNA gyrase (YacG/DUF329 family)
MQKKTICSSCGKEFDAHKKNQRFCSRRCFKKDYSQKTKKANEAMSRRRPVYKCPVCGEKHQMEFDPIRRADLYDQLVCPFCGIPQQTVYTHQEEGFVLGNPSTQNFVIHNAIVSQRTTVTNTIIIESTQIMGWW